MPYTAAILDMVPCGVVVLTTQAKILRVNAHAREIFQANIDFQIDKNILRFRSVAHNRALSNALKQLAEPEANEPTGFNIARSGRRPLAIVLTRLALRQAVDSGKNEKLKIAAFVSDPDINIRPKAELICELFNFTPVQSAISIRMMEQMGPDLIARDLGITNNTLREHFKSMFPKVNAKTKGELLHTLLCSPARFRFPSES